MLAKIKVLLAFVITIEAYKFPIRQAFSTQRMTIPSRRNLINSAAFLLITPTLPASALVAGSPPPQKLKPKPKPTCKSIDDCEAQGAINQRTIDDNFLASTEIGSGRLVSDVSERDVSERDVSERNGKAEGAQLNQFALLCFPQVDEIKVISGVRVGDTKIGEGDIIENGDTVNLRYSLLKTGKRRYVVRALNLRLPRLARRH